VQANLAAYGISCWVRAIVEYDAVVKYVAPKRARLAVAEAEFNTLAQSLQDKRGELDRVQARLADLADRLRCVPYPHVTVLRSQVLFAVTSLQQCV
jgi:dynein heavy chain